MKKLIVLLLALPLLMSSGCNSLDKAGVYAGDQVLYNADLTISTSYDVIHTFVQWEKDNRAVLATTPAIKQFADNVRLNYPNYHRAAMAARNAYVQSASVPNQTALQLALDVLREAVRQANQWLATSSTSSSANPLLKTL